jgi:hypothetical protein
MRIGPITAFLGVMALACSNAVRAQTPPGMQAAGGANTTLPEQLRPPEGETPILRASAKGDQIYVCRAKADGSGFEWGLKAPDATLHDESGRQVATHYAGPTWQAEDGSKVVGQVAANVPAPGGQAIPWLLLKARSHEGSGRFAAVTHIQRLDTTGGLAPTTGCDAGHAGAEQRVPYTAVYAFYKAGG